LELFDFIDCLFSKEKYKAVPNSDKRKHCFMTLRFLSIKYPWEANMYNLIGTNEVSTMDVWHLIMTKTHTRKPQWLYTKSEKRAETSESPLKKVDKDTVSSWCRLRGVGPKDLEFACRVFPSQVASELKAYEKAVEA